MTVEEAVVQRHPELKRQNFVAKLGDGMRGVPMSSSNGGSCRSNLQDQKKEVRP